MKKTGQIYRPERGITALNPSISVSCYANYGRIGISGPIGCPIIVQIVSRRARRSCGYALFS